MKKNIMILLASTFVLGACDYNEKYFKELEDMSKPEDIAKIEHTLTAEEYASIGSLTANKELAIAKDEKLGEEEAIYVKALGQLKTKQAFDEVITASEFAPAFLANKWYTKDENSAVLLTYNQMVDRPEYLTQLEAAKEYVVSADDYENVWGEVEAQFFTPEKTFAKSANDILSDAFKDAEDNDLVAVNYTFSIVEPGGGESSPYYLNEDFEDFSLDSWVQQNNNNPTRLWQYRDYSGNHYLQFSSFKSGAKDECYIITPVVNIRESAELKFDVNVGNYNGDCISVLISTDYVDDAKTATWKDVTSSFTFPQPDKGYSEFQEAGSYDLKDFVGKKIVVAFLYKGDGTGASGAITSTVQLDNVVIAKKGATRSLLTRAVSAVSEKAEIYQLRGSAWVPYTKALVLSRDDYKAMGIDEFSSKAAPSKYLPKYLAQKNPYAEEEAIEAVLYKYDKAFGAAEYVMLNDKWGELPHFVQETSQFVYTNNKWVYNPSTLVVLPVERNNLTSSAFYQAITDWVWENIDQKELGVTKKGEGYVTSYGNNEYYFGASAYQNNMDLRPGKFPEQYAAGYAGLSNEEITTKIKGRYPQAFQVGLEAIYTNVAPIEGIEIIYTVQFGVYDLSNRTFTIKYKVVGPGKFEYIEDSLVEL